LRKLLPDLEDDCFGFCNEEGAMSAVGYLAKMLMKKTLILAAK
jgi:hypothetical protein